MLRVRWDVHPEEEANNWGAIEKIVNKRPIFHKLHNATYRVFVKGSCGASCVHHTSYKWYHKVFFLPWFNLWRKITVNVPKEEQLFNILVNDIKKKIDLSIVDEIVAKLDKGEM